MSADTSREKTIGVNITLPLSVYQNLCDEAKELGISRSAVVTMALKQKKQTDQITENLPALVDVFERMLDRMDKDDRKNRIPK